MTKYIIGAVVGAVLMVGVYAGASVRDEIPYRLLIVGGYNIIRFVDPDNGNVCYFALKIYNAGASISCLKNN